MKYIFSFEYFEKNNFLNLLFEVKWIQGGTLIILIENFKGKNNINFQKTKLILNSIFYKVFEIYIFVWIFRKNLFFEPSVRSDVDPKGDPYHLQKTKLILNSIFYKVFEIYIFVWIFRKSEKYHWQIFYLTPLIIFF